MVDLHESGVDSILNGTNGLRRMIARKKTLPDEGRVDVPLWRTGKHDIYIELASTPVKNILYVGIPLCGDLVHRKVADARQDFFLAHDSRSATFRT